MIQHKPQSSYDILRGRFNYTTEKWWVRILLCLITATFWLLVTYLLKEGVIVGFLLKKLKALPWSSIPTSFNERSP